MRLFSICIITAGAFGLAALGCSSGKAPGTQGPGFDVTVAPLDLPLMTDACYELTVYNTTGAPFDPSAAVWTQPSLCASQYGANGGIRFTGICDAQAGTNSIRLVLNDVYKSGTFETGTALTVGEDYINPCPPAGAGEDNGCVLEAECNPNEDTKIEFNLTVMRNAELGFFDTVVRFQDVFCAAKLDCIDNEDETLTYLYNPETQSDGPTAVLGFVCLGGGGEDIHMYLDDITVTCDSGSATIDVSGGPGNLSSPDLVQTAPDPLFGAAVNTGAGFQGSHYWNVLLGMNLDAANGDCTLTTTGTVSETELIDNDTPAHNRYPFITWNVLLSDDGARACTRHPLDGGNGVATTYTGIDSPEHFDRKLALAGAPLACPCWDEAEVNALAQSIMSGAYDPWGQDESWSGGSQVAFMLEGDNDDELYVVAQADSGSFECAYYADVSGGSEVYVELEITEPEYDACASAIRARMDNPCQTDNGGCSAPAAICIYDGPGQSHCLECQGDEDCQDPTAPNCNTATNTCAHSDPCQLDNGGCATGACWNDAPFSNQCVDCTADVHCDSGTSCDTTHSGSPTWYMCTECGPRTDMQANYYCAAGTWCTLAYTCEEPPTQPIVEVNPNPRTVDTWLTACTALGSYHRPTFAELAAAMQAYFQNGTDMGYVFVQNNGFSTSRYLSAEFVNIGYIAPPGSWNGAQYVFADGFNINSHLLCFPD